MPGGFTLVELLAVVSIMIVLFALAVPAIKGIGDSMKVNLATQKIVEEIQFARATALSQNLPAEVCFLQVTQPAQSSVVFGAVQTRVVYNSGSTKWVSAIHRLPAGMAISTVATYSNFIAAVTPSPMGNSGTNNGIAMRIYPSGAVEMEDKNGNAVSLGGVSPYLTLGRLVEITRDLLPANFVTVQINQRNATVMTYQP